jgi:hypothetical protein
MSENILKDSIHLELLSLLPFPYGEQIDADIVKKQVDVVGGSNLFYKLDRSFKEMKIEPLFVKEQWDLFNWRCTFFGSHFPCGFWRCVVLESLGFVLCCKFDQVASLAVRSCSDVMGDRRQLDEICTISRHEQRFSHAAMHSFDKDTVETDFDYLFHENDKDVFRSYIHDIYLFVPLNFDDLVAMVAEVYPSHVKQLKTLEDFAMRTVLKHGISMEEMSGALRKKSELMMKGKFSVGDEGDTATLKDVRIPLTGVSGFKYVVIRRSTSWKVFVRGKGMSVMRKIQCLCSDYFVDIE